MHEFVEMLQFVLDNEELEEKITKFCTNPIVTHKRVTSDTDEINIALSWWEIDKIWLLGQVKQLKLSEINTFHLSRDTSYIDRVIRVVNDGTRATKWGYMVFNEVKNSYDRDILIAKLTSEAVGDPKFTVPKSAVCLQVDGTSDFTAANLRGWKNLCDVKFGINKVHVITSSSDNFVSAVIFALSALAPKGILVANVIIDDTTRRYIKLLQGYFESVQIRTSSWSHEIFICAEGFKKCPKKIINYMVEHTEDLVNFKLVPQVPYDVYADEYILTRGEKISLSEWLGETAF